MEGGSPALIRQRWTLPMYYAQLRYWGDHPPLEDLAAAYFRIPKRYTPPPRNDLPADGGPVPDALRAALHAPLTAAERGAGGGRTMKADAPWQAI
jgi:hypothetical protein